MTSRLITVTSLTNQKAAVTSVCCCTPIYLLLVINSELRDAFVCVQQIKGWNSEHEVCVSVSEFTCMHTLVCVNSIWTCPGLWLVLTRQTNRVSPAGLNAAHCVCVNDTLIWVVYHCVRHKAPCLRLSLGLTCRTGAFKCVWLLMCKKGKRVWRGLGLVLVHIWI